MNALVYRVRVESVPDPVIQDSRNAIVPLISSASVGATSICIAGTCRQRRDLSWARGLLFPLGTMDAWVAVPAHQGRPLSA